jgi:hypothetical protein
VNQLVRLVFLSIFALMSFQPANAQIPNLAGDWEGYEANGTKSSYVWRVTQSGGNLVFFDVGAGTKTQFDGQIRDGVITDTNAKRGVICVDDSSIYWSDKVVWRLKTGKVPPLKMAPRFSFDCNLYLEDAADKANPWKWNSGTSTTFERTIYNPLDGGILLKYKMPKPSDSDGCSGGAAREKKIFLQACLAHDTNYDAPFRLAGFPTYPSGGSTGQDISDYLFYRDMQLINKRAPTDGVGASINNTAADLFYTGVVLGGKYRGTSAGREIIEKGGVVAVLNNGAFVMTLKVDWTAPDGSARSEEVTKPVGQTAVIPLSAGSRNIRIESWAVLGTTIFKKNFAAPGMYAYTVTGTTLIHSFEEVLRNNARSNAETTFSGAEVRDERRIKFFCEAGYIAEMTVIYMMNEVIGGTKVVVPRVVSTGNLSAGVSRSIVIPKEIVETSPIQVFINGKGTIKNPILTTTVPANFGGERCFKAWGTFLIPETGGC